MSAQMLTIEQCAERLNKKHGSVRRLIGAGKLRAAKVGGVWRVKPEELDAFIERSSNVIVEPVIPQSERLPEPSRRRFM